MLHALPGRKHDISTERLTLTFLLGFYKKPLREVREDQTHSSDALMTEETESHLKTESLFGNIPLFLCVNAFITLEVLVTKFRV